jgi:hypothetical protein
MGDESGSVMVLALVIVTVVALVVGSLLSYADTNVRATVALRAQAAGAATADGAAQAALNALRLNEYNHDTGSATFPECFGASGELVLPDFLPGGTGEAPSSARVVCEPDPSTGASGDTVPITAANKPGNAILTLSTNPAENGLEVKALNSSLPFNVHGGIVSNSNIDVTNGTLRSTVDVRAHTGCSGTIVSTPAAVCNAGTVSDPGYAPEITTVPARRTVPANAAANCPGQVMIFQPGFYDDAAALSDLMEGNGACKDSVWWFPPGVYYFDFLNTGSHQWLLKNGHLLAGTPVDGAGMPLAAPVAPVSVPGGCDNPIHSPTAVGVQFVFGGDSQFQLAGDANAEICGTYHADRPPLAVYGVRTTGTVAPAGGTDLPAGTVTATGFAPTPSTATAAAAVMAPGDGQTLTWAGSPNTGTITASSFSPALSVPAGSTLTSARLKIIYGAGTTAVNSREVVVTPAGGTALPSMSLSADVPSTTGPTGVDLMAALAPTVLTNGLSGLQIAYTTKRTGPSAVTEVIDAIQLDLTWTAPVMRAQSGCITQTYTGGSGCAVVSTTTSYSGHFYIQGTTYTPLAPIDISLSNITEQVLRFGVVSRVLVVKETGSISYDGPVIEIPDDSLGYGPGGTVVFLTVHVCRETNSCGPGAGREALRVRAYIKDAGALGPADGREVVVQSWAPLR